MNKPKFLWQMAFGWMNFALAVPSIYLMLGMPLMMRQYGWSGTEIGLFQLAALPTIFKFLFAVPIQKIDLGRAHFVSWLYALSVPLIILFFWLSSHNLIQQPQLLFIFTFIISILLTCLDIPLNALAVQFFSRTQQIATGSIRSAALFLGAIVGGGIMLLLHHRFGWHLPFILMAIFIIIGLIPFIFLRQHAQLNRQPNHLPSSKTNILHDWKTFFEQPYAKAWMGLLILGFPFIGAAWLYLKPLLLDYGLSIANVALMIGTVGGIVGAMSSLCAGRLAKHLGIAKTMMIYFVISILAILLFTLALWLKISATYLVVFALLIGVGMGGISALLFGLTLLFTRKENNAADYGLQTTLFTISRIGIPIFAGILLDYSGQISMLLFLVTGVTMALIIAWFSRNTIQAKQQHAISEQV